MPLRHTLPLTLCAGLVALAGCAADTTRELEPATEPIVATAEAEPSLRAAGGGFVVSVSEADLRTAPSNQAWVHLLARGDNAFVGVLRMAPGAAVPEHQDPTEEYIYVLDGGGQMTMDGQVYDVGPGMLVFMPAGATVSFQNGDAETVVLQVFAGPGPADKYDAWSAQTAP